MVRRTRWRGLMNHVCVEVLAETDWCVTFRVVGSSKADRAGLCRLDRATFERAYEPCPQGDAPMHAAAGGTARGAACHRAERRPRPAPTRAA